MGCVVYCLRNPLNQKIFYVGATGSKSRRRHQHLVSNSNGLETIKMLHSKKKKPLFEVLETVDDKSTLATREDFWMNNLIAEGCNLENRQTKSFVRPTINTKQYIMRTTKSIMFYLKERSTKNGISVNTLINKILLSWKNKQK